MNWPVETLLTVHIIVVSTFLAVVLSILLRRGLFHWTSAGFWAWVSFALYYALNPLAALYTGTLNRYRICLAIAGGTERGLWILGVALSGMTAFFWAYLRTKPGKITWRLRDDTFTFPMVAFAVLFGAFGVYSLLSYRAFVVDTGRELAFEGGRHVGQVTGYESSAYRFLTIPILLLVSSKSHGARVFGWIAFGLWMLFALPNGWARAGLVSMLIAVSMVEVIQRKAAWPRWFFVPLLLVFTVALTMRGHRMWTLETSSNELLALSRKAVQNLDQSLLDILGSGDAAALSTWYLESWVTEQYTGYSYGLPLINYALTGWIPGRILPQKYFLVDWLAARHRPLPNTQVEWLLYGAKSTLFGSFYQDGWLVGVILMAAGVGVLSRKMDGMMLPEAPLLVRATGAAWMSVLWMVWHSSGIWALIALGVLVMPALAMWLFAPREPAASLHEITYRSYRPNCRKWERVE
ncbi:MAG: hypothetical protein WHX52_13990 [Anaerolineae bacterium]